MLPAELKQYEIRWGSTGVPATRQPRDDGDFIIRRRVCAGASIHLGRRESSVVLRSCVGKAEYWRQGRRARKPRSHAV
jgi:hypothetical protein